MTIEAYEKAVKLWQSWDVRTEADIDLRLDNFRVLFAYNSGKIENEEITYHDTHEIFENGRVLNFTGSPRAIFEVENQKLCYEYLKPKIAARELLSIGLVLETHEALKGGTYDQRRFIERGERPGAFKKHDYVTGRAEVGSLPEDVEGDISDLLAELDEYADKDVMKVATYFHVRFEYIHPFADGNGRVGRALLNYYLMTHNHPPVIIYDEDKAAYYDALERYDNGEELKPMYDFLKSQTARTWEKALAREARHGGEAR
jgi:Fic family protein